MHVHDSRQARRGNDQIANTFPICAKINIRIKEVWIGDAIPVAVTGLADAGLR